MKMPYPLVICYIAIENDPVEIVDFPMKHGGSFHSYVTVYQSFATSAKQLPSPLPISIHQQGRRPAAVRAVRAASKGQAAQAPDAQEEPAGCWKIHSNIGEKREKIGENGG